MVYKRCLKGILFFCLFLNMQLLKKLSENKEKNTKKISQNMYFLLTSGQTTKRRCLYGQKIIQQNVKFF
jgi:hypothetical protein